MLAIDFKNPESPASRARCEEQDFVFPITSQKIKIPTSGKNSQKWGTLFIPLPAEHY
jgi:hypothetical protein